MTVKEVSPGHCHIVGQKPIDIARGIVAYAKQYANPLDQASAEGILRSVTMNDFPIGSRIHTIPDASGHSIHIKVGMDGTVAWLNGEDRNFAQQVMSCATRIDQLATETQNT